MCMDMFNTSDALSIESNTEVLPLLNMAMTGFLGLPILTGGSLSATYGGTSP